MFKSRREFMSILGYSAVVSQTLPWLNGCKEQHISGQVFPKNLGLISNETEPYLGGDQDQPWWLRGNYAPIGEEIIEDNLDIIGYWPPELSGTLIRNGSNPKIEDPAFWFFGDGMLHAIHFENGQAKRYHNRWLNTPAVNGESNGLMAGRANTSIVQHHQKIYALYEISAPFEFSSHNLESIGFHDFEGTLTTPMCAHPKIDPRTGEMWFIGVEQLPPSLSVTMVDRQGQVQKNESMSLMGMYFMHDFQLTENYVILFEFPLLLSLELLTGGKPFDWQPNLGTRIGVMPREGNLSDIQWFNVDPAYMFHSFNAYEEGNEVIVEGCRLLPVEGDDLFTLSAPPKPWRWRLHLGMGTVNESAFEEIYCDFPMIDRRLQGQKNRYHYALSLSAAHDDYPIYPNGIVKMDRESDTLTRWSVGTAIQPDEVLFVPAYEGASEDEGWLISVVYNRATTKSEVLVFDAQELNKGPLARVLLPQRVPFGFHGTWVPHT